MSFLSFADNWSNAENFHVRLRKTKHVGIPDSLSIKQTICKVLNKLQYEKYFEAYFLNRLPRTRYKLPNLTGNKIIKQNNEWVEPYERMALLMLTNAFHDNAYSNNNITLWLHALP